MPLIAGDRHRIIDHAIIGEMHRRIIIIVQVRMGVLDTLVVNRDGDSIAGIVIPDRLDIADQRKMPLVSVKWISWRRH